LAFIFWLFGISWKIFGIEDYYNLFLLLLEYNETVSFGLLRKVDSPVPEPYQRIILLAWVTSFLPVTVASWYLFLPYWLVFATIS
jgi:hypothetical protein